MALWQISSVIATIFVGFGANAIVRPANALSFFGFTIPSSAAETKLVEFLLALYGVRDVFMGAALGAAAWVGDFRVLGLTLISAGAVACADGVLCYLANTGEEWNHAYGVGVIAIGVVAWFKVRIPN
ncbi:hypothetical protein HK100_002995 [Physocladia obscura]|uniref:Uncharacterized protein n=1 Tax=Physocladia obscura TaxID=109957 RepID=A0AAD5XDG5_9FUNG|nr:hypothetical protein HK100_002995 [Physocladia obscura]